MFQREEHTDGGREEESKAEERVGAAVTVGEPGAGGNASQSCWDRRRERRPLCGGAAGPRPRAGTPVRMLHRGLASFGGLVGGVWSKDGCDAVHRRVLDSAVRNLGSARVRGVSGKRAAH